MSLSPPPVLGTYIHFPWCLRKCGYCDFHSIAAPRHDIPHRAYANAVIAELERRCLELEPHRLESIYIGGGTPSLWSPAELGRVVRTICDRFTTSADASADIEISVECNPSSFDEDTARAWLDAGVNRISLGVQSLRNTRLDFLERLHDAQEARQALETSLQVGISRVSADLIYGVATQSPQEAAEEARELAQLGPTHVSAYLLTIEPNTPFGRRASQHLLPVLPEDAAAESFLAVDAALSELGFDHYEISSFARKDHVSRHNMGYWSGHDYLGLGCAAWGTVTLLSDQRRVRYRNTAELSAYLAGNGNLWAPSQLVDEAELITPEMALSERLLLGLRLAQGLDLERAAQELGVPAWSDSRDRIVERLVRQGRLERLGSVLRIPRSAWLLADGTITELL